MAGFALPRLGMRPRASYSGLRPGKVRGFGPLQGMVDGPRKRAVNAGSAARKPISARGGGVTGMGSGVGKAKPSLRGGAIGLGRPKPGPQRPMNSSAAPRQTAQRAVKAARGGSRKAAKRLSERY